MSDIYVTAAFKTDIKDEGYVFMKNEYVKLDFAANRAVDVIKYGPAKTSQFPSLKGTIFADGIDCAFGSPNPGEAYIFAWNNCAKWIYPSDTRGDKIIEGPVPISTMFPFLKGTVFENGVDAAIGSSIKYEVYLFKGDQYARINYSKEAPKLYLVAPIDQYWDSFKGTSFENGGFDAGIIDHLENEVVVAYVFKGDSYMGIKFTPGKAGDKKFSGVNKIKDYWPGLGAILPRKPY